MLLDLLRSAWSVQRQLAARFDGEVAGGADSFFVISGSGRPTDDDVGFAGSGRRRGRAASHGVIDNDRKFRSTDGSVCGVLSLRHFRLAGWCSLSLGGWWPRNPARRILASAARCCSTCSDRPGRCSGSWPHDSMVRSPAAPSTFLFSGIVVRRLVADDGARAIGANDDAAAVELRGRRRQHP